MWDVGDEGVCMFGKMSKDVTMAIRKSIAVLLLPCLVTFWGCHPYMLFNFCNCFFVTCFCC